MNIKLNIIRIVFISTLITIVLLAIAFTIFSMAYKENDNFKKINLENSGEHLSISEYISSHQRGKLIEQFPYELYSKSDNWKSPSIVESDLWILNRYNENQSENERVLSIALTTKLDQWNSNDIDTLNLMLSWVEQFNYQNCSDERYEFLFATIHDYWLDFLAGKLKKLSAAGNTKYLFKYRYLKERCMQANHGVGEPDDNYTKIINNVIDKRWYYLFVERLWRSTGTWFRIFIVSFILITCYSYYRLLLNLIKQ